MVPFFLDQSIEKFVDYNPKFFGGHKPIVFTQILTAPSAMPIFESCRTKSSPTIPANVIHTCHVGFYVDVLST